LQGVGDQIVQNLPQCPRICQRGDWRAGFGGDRDLTVTGRVARAVGGVVQDRGYFDG
jgi:hypothetical protein